MEGDALFGWLRRRKPAVEPSGDNLRAELSSVRRQLESLDEDYVRSPEVAARMRALNADATRIAVPLSEWGTFAPLAAEWSRALARLGGQVDDAESPPEGLHLFFCEGVPTDQVLAQVRTMLPSGFTADLVPVPPESWVGAEIAVSRR